ncbi:MAG: GvpL/GvpF family gas vesicle protein [Dehalococcoidia bacterium]|nr:GvpL/GvpF family gas vesicle protein [Dehalococcoidia bacterium]
MEHKYVYGVVHAEQFACPEIPGMDGSSVYAMVQDGLACVLSDYRGNEFSALSKEQLVRYLLAHQAVVEKVMERHTILPVKFGTVLSGEAEVRAFVSQGRPRLVDAVVQLQDKIEMEVAATWDTSRVLREIADREDILRAREALMSKARDASLQDKVRLGQLVKEAMDERRRGYSERMLEFLGPLALDVHANALVSDQMVMNVAFLLHRDRMEAFDACVGKLNDLFDDQIDFRIIGPLPPYSFATVEVTRLGLEKIEAARRLLRLDEPLSETRVRRAYRRIAADNHPDVRVRDGAGSQAVLRLREASEILLSYCRQSGVKEPLRNRINTVDSISLALLVNVRPLIGETMNSRRLSGLAGPAKWPGSYASAS